MTAPHVEGRIRKKKKTVKQTCKREIPNPGSGKRQVYNYLASIIGNKADVRAKAPSLKQHDGKRGKRMAGRWYPVTLTRLGPP